MAVNPPSGRGASPPAAVGVSGRPGTSPQTRSAAGPDAGNYRRTNVSAPANAPAPSAKSVARRVGGTVRRSEPGASGGYVGSSPPTVSNARGGGYSGGAAQGSNVPEWRTKLEQVKRETREMKAMEMQIKWNMKREEEKHRKSERCDDKKEILKWRQDQQRDAHEYQAAQRREAKLNELQESRDFQETKRAVKQAEKEEDLLQNKEQYVETKENSEWHVELKKVTEPERRRLIVEEHLERYKLVAEDNLEKQQCEKREERESEMARKQSEMNHQLMQAQMERDRVLASVEHLRGRQHLKVSNHLHHPARPANRAEY